MIVAGVISVGLLGSGELLCSGSLMLRVEILDLGLTENAMVELEDRSWFDKVCIGEA